MWLSPYRQEVFNEDQPVKDLESPSGILRFYIQSHCPVCGSAHYQMVQSTSDEQKERGKKKKKGKKRKVELFTLHP